jgi:glutamate--cysteine ligase
VNVAINTDNDMLISGVDDLLRPFHEACKPPSAFRVGTEAEKFGWLLDVRAPLPFAGPRSVQTIFTGLVERYGWKPEREQPTGEVLALLRDQASITLEPAGQLELSGAPLDSIHATALEFREHFRELHDVADPLGVSWMSLGFHPFATQDALPHVPKLRYAIMERYLPTRGSRALDMMRRTCTVQANLDYASEQDATRKLRVGLALQPIVTGMLANSPFYEGKKGPRMSERADVWLHMDPDRTGLLPFAWERDMSFRAYVEWALDAPMFLVKRDGQVTDNTQQSFRTFLRDGLQGTRATLSDWKTHINTLFPEVRLKNTIEMRGADAQSGTLLCATPALWKGLLYDDKALAQAESLISPLSAQLLTGLRAEIAQVGLRTKLLGRPLAAWANDVLDIACGGLQRLNVNNEQGESEAIYLSGLRPLVKEEICPAQTLLARVRDGGDFMQQVVTATSV